MGFIIVSIISVLLWCLKTALFCTPFNRAIQIISLLVSAIPILGAGWILVILILFFCMYSHSGCDYNYKYGKQFVDPTNDLDDTVVRDTKLGRWLFNELDWERLEEKKQNSK